MGITVSASLAIALGPIKGGVYIYLGITAIYRNDSGLALGVMVLIRGEVSVLGIAFSAWSIFVEASQGKQPVDKWVWPMGWPASCKCYALGVDEFQVRWSRAYAS